VSNHGCGVADELHGAGQRDIAGALGLADHELGDVHTETFRNIVRQAFDFDGAGDDFEQAALHLDALSLAEGGHRHADADALGEIDAFKIGMQQIALHRVHLLIDDHHRGGFTAPDGQVENGVVTRCAANNLVDVARVDGDADRIFEGPIDNGGNLAGATGAMGFILAARGTYLGGDR